MPSVFGVAEDLYRDRVSFETKRGERDDFDPVNTSELIKNIQSVEDSYKWAADISKDIFSVRYA